MAASDDVVVVGGGPAGALTALLLARRGWRVRVFDRERFPRPKLCGDTLNPGAMAVLGRHLNCDALRARALPLRGMRLSGPGGVVVTGRYPSGIEGVSITRADFNHWLLTCAAREGVVVQESTAVDAAVVASGTVNGVRVRGRGGCVSHQARLVVGADGRRSTLASSLGLSRTPASPRRWAFGAYAEGVADVRPDMGEMHVRPGSYVGIAPVAGGLTNVCVVMPFDRARGVVADASAAILAAAQGDRATAARFVGARLASPPIVLGPMAVDVTTPGVSGLLLVGDAAGFIDPMTGDGLRLALDSAELAAAVADDVLAGRLAPARAPAATRAPSPSGVRREVAVQSERADSGERARGRGDGRVRGARVAARIRACHLVCRRRRPRGSEHSRMTCRWP